MAVVSGGVANAYDFNDKIYGKATAGISYSLQHVQGDILDENNLERDHGIGSTDYQHNLGFHIGYNFYYKVNSLLHPFVGLEATARAPLKAKTRNITNQYNHASFDIKAGMRFNEVFKKTSFQVYGIFGVAILERHNKTADEFNAIMEQLGDDYRIKKHEIVPALNYGVGANVIYDYSKNLALTGGFDYKRAKATKRTTATNFLLETDQFDFKFGIMFL